MSSPTPSGGFEVKCPGCGVMGKALSHCKHCDEFLEVTVATPESRNNEPKPVTAPQEDRTTWARYWTHWYNKHMAEAAEAKRLAESYGASFPSAGGAIERCPKCNGDQRGAPCAYPEACGHPCRTYIAERNQALLAAASAGRDRELAEGVLKLTKTVRYLVGIAEVGEGRPMLDDETAEQFVLRYVQRLEQELRALRSHGGASK
jgi:hypothetical protein